MNKTSRDLPYSIATNREMVDWFLMNAINANKVMSNDAVKSSTSNDKPKVMRMQPQKNKNRNREKNKNFDL